MVHTSPPYCYSDTPQVSVRCGFVFIFTCFHFIVFAILSDCSFDLCTDPWLKCVMYFLNIGGFFRDGSSTGL